jgi:hypothetical protein
LANLPPQLSELRGYFAGSTASDASGKWTDDQNAWQNKGWGAYSGSEATRTENWPFVVGFV